MNAFKTMSALEWVVRNFIVMVQGRRDQLVDNLLFWGDGVGIAFIGCSALRGSQSQAFPPATYLG